MQTEKTMTTISIEELSRNSTITTNVEQKYIITTSDKIKLILIDWEKRKKVATEWWSYLGMALSFIIPLFTADFKDFLGFSAEALKALFVFLSAIFSIMTFVALVRRIWNHKMITVDHCVGEITKSNQKIDKSNSLS